MITVWGKTFTDQTIKIMTANKKIHLGCWLLFIVVLSIFARLPEFRTIIPEQGINSSKIIWFDEAYSIYFAEQNFSRVIQLSSYDSTPPLFYLSLWGWHKVVGSNIIGLAVLPFVFSILSVLAIFFLGKQIFNYKIGLLSSLFFSLSALNIDYSTEIRAYSLLVFLSCLSMIFWWRILEKPSQKNWLLYVLFTTLCLYTHYTAFVLVALQGFLMVIYRREEIKRIVCYYILIFILFLPQLLIFGRWSNIFSGGSGPAPLFSRIFTHGSPLIFGKYFYNLMFGRTGGSSWLVVAGGFAVFVLLMVLAVKYRSEVKMRILFWFIVGGFLGLAALKFIYAEKYFLIFTVPVVIFIAAVFFQIRQRFAKVCLLVLIIAASGLSTARTYFPPRADSFLYYARDAFQFIENNEQPGDLILVDHFNDLLLPFYYHGGAEKKFFLPLNNELVSENENKRWLYWDYNVMTEENVKLAEELIQNYERIWLFNYLPQKTSVQDPGGYLVGHLKQKLKPVKYYYFPDKITGVQQTQLILFEK